MPRTRRLLALVAALVTVCALAVVAAGCGEEELPDVSAAEAAAATREAGTARFDFRFDVKGLGLSQPLTITAKGVSRTDAPDSDTTIDLGEALELLGVEGDGESRLLVVDDRVFLDPPDIEGLNMPGDTTWVTVDLAQVVEAAGLDPVGLSEYVRLSLAQQVAALEAAKSMKAVGEEEIDGVNTVHLRGTTRLSDYLTVLPAERRRRAERAIRELEEQFDLEPGEMDEPAPTEMWIDGDRLLRRLVTTSKSPAEEGVPAGEMTMTMNVTDYGVEMDLEAPPDDDVFDATDRVVDAIASGALRG